MTGKTPPPTLSGSSRRIWREVCRSYELELSDLVVLRVALEQLDLYQTALAELVRDGFTLVSGSGSTKANPAIAALTTARIGFLRAWGELGFGMEPPQAVGRPPDGRELRWHERLQIVPRTGGER